MNPLDEVATLNGQSFTAQEIEQFERATAAFVAKAVERCVPEMEETFARDIDDVSAVGEDLVRTAIDNLGTSKIGKRLFGRGDFKLSRFIFLPDVTVPQALLVDSKAEKSAGTITVEMTQTTMQVHQLRNGKVLCAPCFVPAITTQDGVDLLTTTIFVKFVYSESTPPSPLTAPASGVMSKSIPTLTRTLDEVMVVTLPSGLLQDAYNPDANHAKMWRAGRNAQSLGERFRVRVQPLGLATCIGADPSVPDASWRVQRFGVSTPGKKRVVKWNSRVDARHLTLVQASSESAPVAL